MLFFKMRMLCLILVNLAIPMLLNAQEICNNGIDDDGNGLVDLNDPGCQFSSVLLQPGIISLLPNHSFEERICCPGGFVSPISPPWLSCASGWRPANIGTTDYFNECGYSPAGFNLPSPAGDGAVGLYAIPDEHYFEYLGRVLSLPDEPSFLKADSSYILSFLVSSAAASDQFDQSQEEGRNIDPFTAQVPLAIYGFTGVQDTFPSNYACLGLAPDWQLLGSTQVSLNWDWSRATIAFTPQSDINVIAIGGGCEVPQELGRRYVTNPITLTGKILSPYYLIDDLLLTGSDEQRGIYISRSGSFCNGSLTLVADVPDGAEHGQWYHNGAALVGDTLTTLDSATIAFIGAGTYAYASMIDGTMLVNSFYVSGFCAPLNDLCQNAAQLQLDQMGELFSTSVTGDLEHATTSLPAPACVDSASYEWVDNWYSLSALAGDHLELSLDLDTAAAVGMEVKAGACSDTALACTNDGSPISFAIANAGTYLVRVFSLAARDLGDVYVLHVTLDRPTGVRSPSYFDLGIHPNPSNGDFTFMLEHAVSNATITLRDVSGRTMYHEERTLTTATPVQLQLRGQLSPGTYFLEVRSTSGRALAKLVVDH